MSLPEIDPNSVQIPERFSVFLDGQGELYQQLFGNVPVFDSDPQTECSIVPFRTAEVVEMKARQIFPASGDEASIPLQPHILTYRHTGDSVIEMLLELPRTSVGFETSAHGQQVPDEYQQIEKRRATKHELRTIADVLQVDATYLRMDYVLNAGPLSVYALNVVPQWSLAEELKKEQQAQRRALQPDAKKDTQILGSMIGIGGGAIATIAWILSHAAPVFAAAAVDPMVALLDPDDPMVTGFCNSDEVRIFNQNSILAAKLAVEALLNKDTAKWLQDVSKDRWFPHVPPAYLQDDIANSQSIAMRNAEFLQGFPVSQATRDLGAMAALYYLKGLGKSGDFAEMTDEELLAFQERLQQ